MVLNFSIYIDDCKKDRYNTNIHENQINMIYLACIKHHRNDKESGKNE